MLDLLRQIPQLEVDYAPMTCCGAGGAHGFKRRYYESAQKQGAETLGFLKRVQPDAVVTDCPMCAHRIGTDSGIKTVHPIEFLMDSVAM